MTDVRLRLRRREARRIQLGHPWIFANEVEQVDPPAASEGLCSVYDDSNRYIGTGYYNKHSLICARLLTRHADEPIDQAFFQARLAQALKRRRTLCAGRDAYRWVFGEADGLPGFVADLYPGLVVVQVATLGMERLRVFWEPPLRELAGERSLLVRNDLGVRSREGLSSYVEFPDGLPGEPLRFEEAGVPVAALPCRGQKTGFYLDQSTNRIWTRRLCEGADALDLYCYTGAWGQGFLHAGARRVSFVDSSEAALAACRQLVASGYPESRFRILREDALEFLKACQTRRETYDVVAIDPPDLIPTRKALGPGRKHYVNVYQAGLQVVTPGGFAVLSCCSYHLPEGEFDAVIAHAARRARRAANIVWRGGAAPDHPRPVSVPESHYLKCVVLQVG